MKRSVKWLLAHGLIFHKFTAKTIRILAGESHTSNMKILIQLFRMSYTHSACIEITYFAFV